MLVLSLFLSLLNPKMYQVVPVVFVGESQIVFYDLYDLRLVDQAD